MWLEFLKILAYLQNWSLVFSAVVRAFIVGQKKLALVKFSPISWIGVGIIGSLQVQQQKDKQYADM